MLREEHVTTQRKHLRKGGMIFFNGVHMIVEEFLTLGEDPSERSATPRVNP